MNENFEQWLEKQVYTLQVYTLNVSSTGEGEWMVIPNGIYNSNRNWDWKEVLEWNERVYKLAQRAKRLW